MPGILPALSLTLVATCCFGTATFLASKSAKDLGAIQTLFLFQLLGIPAFLFLFPFAPSSVHVQLVPILVIGIYQGLCMILWFYALKVGNVSIVSPVSEVYSLISVALGVVFLHESVGLLRFGGIGLVFIGVVLLGINFAELKKTKSIALYKGIVPALLYAVGVAIFFFFSVIAARQSGWFVSALGIRSAIVGVAFVILLAQKTQWREMVQNISWGWIGTAGMLDAIGFALFSLASTFSQVSYVTVVISAQSVVTVILSYFFFKEKLKFYQVVGLVGVVLGLVFLQLH